MTQEKSNVKNTDSLELVSVTNSLNDNFASRKKGALLLICTLSGGHPLFLYADTSIRNQRTAYSTDLNLHQLPSLSDRFIKLTQKEVALDKYKFFGLRILTQAGGYRLPGLATATFAQFNAVGGVTGALNFGAELGYVEKPWGASFIFDWAPVGIPIPGASSITSQYSYKFAVHHFSKWFQKPTRFSFVFTPLTTLVVPYPQSTLSHNGMGFSIEAQIEGPRWRDDYLNWVFSLNWNRMTWVKLGNVPSGTDANWVSSEIMGTEGGSTQMIYALIGMEMNFSVR